MALIEVINLNNLEGRKKEYDVVGYICEKDTLLKKKDSNTSKGDLICFRNAGAYCLIWPVTTIADQDQLRFVLQENFIKFVRQKT